MAVTKQISTTSLSIEVQNGVDKAGDPTYTNKTFSGVRTDVSPDNAYAVAEAVKDVLSANVGAIMLNDTSTLDQA